MTYPGYGYTVGPTDFPAREGKHVDYDSPEWFAMKADAAALVPRDAAVDPCAEVARNLAEMDKENLLAAARLRRRNAVAQIREAAAVVDEPEPEPTVTAPETGTKEWVEWILRLVEGESCW